ncbi:MAG: Gfo/Idh/MocA family oxidoreductase [Bryobacteraceae bacterium]|nr:Gfo/Idh/MocA family oxidoreductase [Bryobacteraceae bacterium]
MQGRRQFMTAAAMTAISYRRVLGANDRIRVANIGCGRRQLLRDLMTVKDSAQITVTAVCDTWKQKLDAAVAQVKEFAGNTPAATPRYLEAMNRSDVDAVVIGTPDHQHCTMLVDAIKAGKHVYVEKPLAMNMEELIRAYDAVKASDRVVQIGTQMRSYPQANGLKQFLAQKRLGGLLKVEQVRNGFSPYWMSFGGGGFHGEPPQAGDVDWDAFLMGREKRPFDPNQYQNWYGYSDFSQGPHTNLMVHFIDLMHYTTGAVFPSKVVALGGTYRWKSAFDVPDSVEVVYEYPEGFLVRYCTMFGNGANNYAKWFGTLGTVDAARLSPREKWVATGEGSGEPDKIAARIEIDEPATVHHMQDFIESIRTGRKPIAPIEAGYSHSVAVIAADRALREGRRLTYNPQKREIVPI